NLHRPSLGILFVSVVQDQNRVSGLQVSSSGAAVSSDDLNRVVRLVRVRRDEHDLAGPGNDEHFVLPENRRVIDLQGRGMRPVLLGTCVLTPSRIPLALKPAELSSIDGGFAQLLQQDSERAGIRLQLSDSVRKVNIPAFL